MDRNGDMLRRIIGLLYSLARLADFAACLPRPVRYFLLGILRRAEIAGRNLVAQEASALRMAPWLPDQTQAHGGNEPDDALILAYCLRLLALTLAGFAAIQRRGTGNSNAPPLAMVGDFAAIVLGFCAFKPTVIDTS